MSKNYRVEVQETYQRVFHKVNAESDDEALKQVSDEYHLPAKLNNNLIFYF